MPTPTLPLQSKVALITGASRGIGAAIAKRLAADGASVMITYSNSPDRANEVVKEIETAGGKAKAVRADSGKQPDIKAAFDATLRDFGKIDIVVNNAGVGGGSPITEVTPDAYHQMTAVNIDGVFFGTQEAARTLGEGGRIINIGSCLGDRVPFPNLSVYCMTKAAVAGLGRALARELGPRGITINTIQPGPIDTELNPANGPSADTMRANMALTRYGHVEEVAAAASLLAGPQGSFITGTTITVDGGFNA